ncbi:hypothetical protein MPER_02367 [Moniliophthora perniciosa FA553]|nr:hypothetical protein MPER_02367 [Moniliophthora perniciosa FA553]
MNSATTVGNSVKISTPTLSWERVGANVNEGPAALYHGGPRGPSMVARFSPVRMGTTRSELAQVDAKS